MEGNSATIAGPATDPVVCPYLGLADDPRTHFAFATIDHQCHSGAGSKQIETTHQGSFCLGANYSDCRRYLVPSAPPAPVVRVAGSAPVQTAPNQQKQGTSGLRRPGVRLVGILAGAFILALVAALFLGQRASAPGGPGGASSSSPAAGLASPPGVSPSAPTNSRGPTSTAATTAGPSGPALPTTHIVTRGETLTTIADYYHVTVAAIQKANGLKDPNVITVGQLLIIPAP